MSNTSWVLGKRSACVTQEGSWVICKCPGQEFRGWEGEMEGQVWGWGLGERRVGSFTFHLPHFSPIWDTYKFLSVDKNKCWLFRIPTAPEAARGTLFAELVDREDARCRDGAGAKHQIRQEGTETSSGKVWVVDMSAGELEASWGRIRERGGGCGWRLRSKTRKANPERGLPLSLPPALLPSSLLSSLSHEILCSRQYRPHDRPWWTWV